MGQRKERGVIMEESGVLGESNGAIHLAIHLDNTGLFIGLQMDSPFKLKDPTIWVLNESP